jgi:HD-like signal output (HDOD) protein
MLAHLDDDMATPIDKEAFAFVQSLADDLSRGQIELPSFPEAVIRVRRVLANDNVSLEKVRLAVGTEPALAARIMQMANSAALNRLGRSVLDLRAAISRIGFDLVRSAALSFAMAQMRRSKDLAPVGELLQAQWERSNKVAAYCHVVARRYSTVNADTALLTGLLHGVGRLYIISRSVRYPRLFADAITFSSIEREWSESITSALLGNWGLDGEVLNAVRHFEELNREHDGPVDLSDVLTVAAILASLHGYPDTLELNLQNVRAAQRMKLDRKTLDLLLSESAEEIAMLQAALTE